MIRYEPTGKNLAVGLCGSLGPISGASARDSAWAINFEPNRSAAAGSSRAMYFTICSRSFLLRAEKITSQAMSELPGEVDPHCGFAPRQGHAQLRRVTQSAPRARLRLEHPSRTVRASNLDSKASRSAADSCSIACSICSMLTLLNLSLNSDLSNSPIRHGSVSPKRFAHAVVVDASNTAPKRSVLSTINFCADGLPKLKDFPAAIGGSGETIPE
jgi:hypothetical protein